MAHARHTTQHRMLPNSLTNIFASEPSDGGPHHAAFNGAPLPTRHPGVGSDEKLNTFESATKRIDRCSGSGPYTSILETYARLAVSRFWSSLQAPLGFNSGRQRSARRGRQVYGLEFIPRDFISGGLYTLYYVCMLYVCTGVNLPVARAARVGALFLQEEERHSFFLT